jgi:membrane protein DedA with SNARE-associated domain
MFGIDFSQAGLFSFFGQYAYQPELVYGFVFLFMLLSAVGLPIPEEVVLLSSGFVAYLGAHPQEFPPPFPGAVPVEMRTLMLVCTLAVLFSDVLVFSIGKFLGGRLMRHPWTQKKMSGSTYSTILKWFDKYGAWCCGIFRFTPGLRFPGHIACGMMVPAWKFLLIDICAILISVPTQVWLVATYGKEIIATIKEFQIILVAVFVVVFAVWWWRRRQAERRALP